MATFLKPRSREELAYRATAYEVIASLPNGSTMRLGFTSHANRASFAKLARAHGPALLEYVTRDEPVTYSQRAGLGLGCGVFVKLSGRTERECADAEAR